MHMYGCMDVCYGYYAIAVHPAHYQTHPAPVVNSESQGQGTGWSIV